MEVWTRNCKFVPKQISFPLEIIHSIKNFTNKEKTVVTIGTFDGVHVGHQKILSQLIVTAKKEKKKSVLLTFFPHPRMVLQKDVNIELINTLEEKASLLDDLGLDYLIVHPFDKEFSRLTALDFVRDVLVNQLKTSKLVIGYDHHFGKNREGNIEQLTEYSHLYGFKVEEIPAQDIDSVAVSSTKIRKALQEGHLKTANKYLGYHFMLSGTVVGGEKNGSKIGFPTANLEIDKDYKLIPKNGAYVVKSIIDSASYFGMMNIGYRPTLKGNYRTIEIHFFDYFGDLYGKAVSVSLLYFLREEKTFDSLDGLKTQLNKDREASLDFIKNQL